jgi:lycopene beta-cyclase
MRQASASSDLAIVGGGLQGGLCALAFLARNPDARVLLVEGGPSVGGNHTWCFHALDLPERAASFSESLVTNTWDGYDVMFPNRSRSLRTPYAAITSERFARVVEAAFRKRPGSSLLTNATARSFDATSVELTDGRRFQAKLVVDARGPERFECGDRVAYQKFLGLELELRAPHGLMRPILMDARVPQTDGFRFFYVLPLGPRRLLVEDTYYSVEARLELDSLRQGVLGYARNFGWIPEEIVREETGVLPIPARAMHRARAELPLQAGYRGGWFHPTTGYSFPAATRLALHVAETNPEPAALFGPAWDRMCREHERQQRFFSFLNRLLFGAFRPEDRWNVLERFYGLPEPTIARFYAMSTTATDRARILCGRWPRGLSVRTALSGGVSA